jgi:hypothetical protein
MRENAAPFDRVSLEARNRRLLLVLVLVAVLLALGAAAFILWSRGRVEMTEPFHSELRSGTTATVHV